MRKRRKGGIDKQINEIEREDKNNSDDKLIIIGRKNTKRNTTKIRRK